MSASKEFARVMNELEGSTMLTPQQDIDIEDIISELENIRGDRKGVSGVEDGVDKYIRIAIGHLAACGLAGVTIKAQ